MSTPMNNIKQALGSRGGLLSVVFSPQKISPAVLRFKELWIALPYTMYLLYAQGKADKKGQSGRSALIGTSLLEGALSYGLLTTTSWFYPILGLGWACYQAGKAENKEQRWHAGLRSLIMFGMGAIGVRAGQIYSDGLSYQDAHLVSQRVADFTGEHKTLLERILSGKHTSGTMEAHLQPALKELQEAAGNVTHLYDEHYRTIANQYSKTFNTGKDFLASTKQFFKELFDSSKRAQRFDNEGKLVKNYKDALTKFEEAQQSFLQAFDTLTPNHRKALGSSEELMTKLRGVVSHAQTWKPIRVINPIIGYTAALVIGCAIVRKVYKTFCVNKQKPGQPIHMPDLPRACSSLYVDPLRQRFFGGGHGGGHNAMPSHMHMPYGGYSPYMSTMGAGMH